MTTLVFFQNSGCEGIPFGNITGPPSGQCTQFGIGSFASFRVETLERTCAVTIYNSDEAFCSSSILEVATFGSCYTNTSVNQCESNLPVSHRGRDLPDSFGADIGL
jgi:hypothetical protein